jgi:fumarate hydratase class II
MMDVTYRDEQDSMGLVRVPKEAYYGAQTERARGNFQISDLRFPRSFYKALGLIKKHAARVNLDLDLLVHDSADAMIQACEEVISGEFDDQFVVDVFQTGSGTSTNMNTNEVIAGRANEMMTGKRGGKSPVHPNDHVNKGQSSNDVIPSAIHISTLMELREDLLPAMKTLQTALSKKAEEFKDVRKIARTHLQDAVPISLGQIFSGYARQVELNIDRIAGLENNLGELALGGTAVGTGVNTHPEFAEKVIEGIAEETGCPFREAENHFEAQAARDTAVETSGALKTYAVSLIKIANDIRFLSSGPRCGLGEIVIPDMQPGSSIMPGKVNPVIPEAVIQVAGHVIGNDAAISFGGQAGNFELNVMLPLIAYNLLQSVQLLSSCSTHLAEKCVTGILADHDRCTSSLEKSLSLATAFVPEVGYDQSAALAKEAYQTGKTIREVAKANKILPDNRIDEILDKMISGK